MLEADGLSVAVELMPLIRGDVRIKGVQLDRAAYLLLEAGRDGLGNWIFADGAANDGWSIGGRHRDPRVSRWIRR